MVNKFNLPNLIRGQESLQILSSLVVKRLSLAILLLAITSTFSFGQNLDFSHRYKVWEGDWMPVDTSLRITELFAQEPLENDWYGFLSLGNQGAWRQNLIFQDILSPEGNFGNRAFDQHFRKPEEWTYYNVRSPLTDADYRQGYERGQLFRIYHTQNVHERLNFFFDFSRLNSLGPYSNQQVEQSDVLLTMHYTTDSGMYAFHGGFNTGFIKAEANGGLLYDTVFSDNTILDRSIVPVVSLNGEHFLRHRSALFDQSLRIINREIDSTYSGWLEKLQIDHRFTYLRQSMVFTDIPGENTPNPILQSNETNDSTAFERVENSLGVSIEGALDLSAALWLASNSNDGVNYRSVQNSVGFKAAVSTVISKKFPLRAKLNYILQGPRQGGLEIFAETGFKNQSFEFLPYARLISGFPGYQFYRYTSNYKAWNQSYQLMTRSEFGLRVKQNFIGELALQVFQWSNPVYYNSSALPTQSNNSSGYASINWESEYKWGFLYLNNRATWQIVDKSDPFIQVPDFYFRETVYSQFTLFNRVLELQPGIALTWFSSYNMPGYDSYANVFFFQNSQNIGNFPLIDIFINARLGRAEFFMEFEHANFFLTGYNYWAAPGYPLPDYYFRMGINWRFFN